jgi:1-acyl-sn-glycerol-3-phosphate acyltransferase
MLIFALSIAVTCLGIVVIQRFLMPALALIAMGEGQAALIWLFNKVYVRIIHRIKAYGCDIVPNTVHPGKLIVVCKHQSPIDPLLVQSKCRFKIRWLMAQEFMHPSLAYVWKHSGVIPIARDGQDSAGLRIALKHLKKNGVIGIFPEAGIKQPRRAIHPFADGVGAMIAHTNAKVLLVTVDGTPKNNEMENALFERSHSVVRFIDLIEYPPSATKSEITSDLRTRLSQATGWSLVN